MTTTEAQSGVQWANELKDGWELGRSHAYILHGNVYDYAGMGQNAPVTNEKFLAGVLAGWVVVTYDLSNGLRFPFGNDHARAFAERVGLVQAQENLTAAQRAMRRAGGQQAAASADSPLEFPTSPSECLALIEMFLTTEPDADKGEKPGAAILMYLETIAPDARYSELSPDQVQAMVRLQNMGRNYAAFQKSRAIIVGVTRDRGGVHEDLRASTARWEPLEVTVPNESGRLSFIASYLGTLDEPIELGEGLDLNSFARYSAGLNFMQIEDVILTAANSGEPLTFAMIQDRKNRVTEQEFGSVIDLVTPTSGFEAVAGKRYLIEYFRRSVIRSLRMGITERVPKGVLLLGPAGTGKSHLSKCLAKEAGCNFVELNFSKILGQFVGNSERNLERALTMIKNLAPTVVFVDEIDQSLSRGNGGDSGVGSRLFKRLMEFMGDPAMRGEVIWLAASNKPDLIDEAMIRDGRFDKKVLVGKADEEERRALFPVMLKRYGHECTLSGADLDMLVERTDGRTGAEIETLVVKALELADDDRWAEANDDPTRYFELNTVVTAQHLITAMQRTRPTTRAVQEMTMEALKYVNDADLLPPELRDLWATLQVDEPAPAATTEAAPATNGLGEETRRGKRRTL